MAGVLTHDQGGKHEIKPCRHATNPVLSGVIEIQAIKLYQAAIYGMGS